MEMTQLARTSPAPTEVRPVEAMSVLRSLDERVVREWMRYAELVTRRGYVSSQLGNIAIRVAHECDKNHGVLYTKHRGVSLEEATVANLVVTDISGKRLLGSVDPSIGHQLNVEVFRCRPDVNAVIHLHVDEVLSYFSVTGVREFNYISNDTGIILGKPPFVLEPHINIETDVSTLPRFIHDTNVFVMPNHGVTAVGATTSEAYNRINAFVAEVRRLQNALLLSAALKRPVPYLSSEEAEELYSLSATVV